MYLLNINVLPLVKYIRPNSVLVICCGLLAKWLRVRVRAWARECTSCTCTFFPSGLISVLNTFVFVGSLVSVCDITYGYSIDDVMQHESW